MPEFGVIAIPTHYTIKPVELGRWVEAHGFESLWMGEHSHIPTSRQSPYPLGGDLPQMYKEFFDPFIGLTAVAADLAAVRQAAVASQIRLSRSTSTTCTQRALRPI